MIEFINLSKDKPIHLISVAEPSAEPVVFHPRFMINAGQNSKATFFESHVGAQNNNYFSVGIEN